MPDIQPARKHAISDNCATAFFMLNGLLGPYVIQPLTERYALSVVNQMNDLALGTHERAPQIVIELSEDTPPGVISSDSSGFVINAFQGSGVPLSWPPSKDHQVVFRNKLPTAINIAILSHK